MLPISPCNPPARLTLAPVARDPLIRCAGALAAILLPEMALADCPVGSDLARGIEITDAAGVTETFRAEPPDTVIVLTRGPDYEYRVELRDGIWLRVTGPSDGGEFIADLQLIFDLAALDLPDPAPGAHFEGEVTSISFAGVHPVQVIYEFGQPEDLEIGDCRYEILPVLMRFPGETPTYYEKVQYFPTLGLSRILERGQDGIAEPLETSPAARIRTAP